MTDAKTILEMIEAVDPADTAKLDEIDRCVWCYIHNEIKVPVYWCWPPVSTSRDALKAIRPKGYTWMAEFREDRGCDFTYFQPQWSERFPSKTEIGTPFLPTEELAELHAIIQAIAFDRAQSAKAA